MNILKKISLQLLCAAALFASANASATPMLEKVDPSPDIKVAFGQSTYTYFHDLTTVGFIVGSNSVLSATLIFNLVDYGPGFINGSEQFKFYIGNNGQVLECLTGNCVADNYVTSQFIVPLTAGSIADLTADGKISITLTALFGNFAFADSVLIANVVPEPGMLALLGLGLFGLALARKRVG